MDKDLGPENWEGADAHRWEVRSCRDALADVVTIGFGFLSGLQHEALCEAYNQLLLAQPASRARLLGDFETRRWLAHIQSELAQGKLSHTEVSIESPSGFEFMNRLALAAAVMERQEYQGLIWTSGYRLRLPGIGSRLKLPSSDSPYLLLETDKWGQVRCTLGEVVNSPAPLISGFEVLLAGSEVNLPLEEGYEALTEAEADWTAWEGLLGRVAALLTAQASAESLVRELVHGVVPLRPSYTDSHLSSSFRELPGVVSLVFSNELDVAEALVHEADHQRFYIQTAVESVWEADQTELAVYRSPWRPDPRPLDGLLAGASAFATVANFWACVVAVAAVQPIVPMKLDCDYLGYRATHAMLQVEEALGVIRRYGRLTPEGGRFLSVLEERNRQARGELEGHMGFSDWLAKGSVRCETHRLEWAHRHRCTGEVLASVAPPGKSDSH
jgi:HEXXH motif-containing protein